MLNIDVGLSLAQLQMSRRSFNENLVRALMHIIASLKLIRLLNWISVLFLPSLFLLGIIELNSRETLLPSPALLVVVSLSVSFCFN